MGETGLNAIFCGKLGVPVALAGGDERLCLGGLQYSWCELGYLFSQRGCVGASPLRPLPPSMTSVMIKSAVKSALDMAAEGKSPVLAIEPPYLMEVTFHTAAQTDAVAFVPGGERVCAEG